MCVSLFILSLQKQAMPVRDTGTSLSCTQSLSQKSKAQGKTFVTGMQPHVEEREITQMSSVNSSTFTPEVPHFPGQETGHLRMTLLLRLESGTSGQLVRGRNCQGVLGQ